MTTGERIKARRKQLSISADELAVRECRYPCFCTICASVQTNLYMFVLFCLFLFITRFITRSPAEAGPSHSCMLYLSRSSLTSFIASS